ncbi:hypothetical protein RO3G_00530 [Rhizopus delemar RA 99-880]|uniref:Uncharacterized protein n=1 Tax=Rhizopus delemar (strain RA 99-880 / ATCC MYA-4621 / FGSC 9543 / NRRL 43880) TaxID=246409 RepID=I1BHZ6_RHIO9|nr:hypothetical protein RO3G_00530 [Rhizopus delemar RA 99-880]|eukprot:EIE75826.1 hypothetical protein RO3G_00530 [Rhizopus delemar RA 99-880]
MKAYYLTEDHSVEEEQCAGGFLSFRKMKLSSFINQQQADKRLAKKLREKFGKDTILILSNWLAGNVKHHEPMRDVGMRRMLAKDGLQVYLFDEFQTSSLCPSCRNGELETFKKVATSTIEATAKIPLRRLWNCDMAATLNFRHILFSLRTNGERLERFCKLKKSLSTNSKRKNISSSSASTSRRTKIPNNPL